MFYLMVPLGVELSACYKHKKSYECFANKSTTVAHLTMFVMYICEGWREKKNIAQRVFFLSLYRYFKKMFWTTRNELQYKSLWFNDWFSMLSNVTQSTLWFCSHKSHLVVVTVWKGSEAIEIKESHEIHIISA